jgi:hypothetical protein
MNLYNRDGAFQQCAKVCERGAKEGHIFFLQLIFLDTAH